jgi:hypothetical protein
MVRVSRISPNRKSKKLYHAVVITKPEGWRPRNALDFPAGISESSADNFGDIVSLAQGFNQEEIDNPTGRWCLVVRSQAVS